MKTAKLFRHGGSQAVRLPKEFRFSGKEVAIERRGEEVVLRPVVKPKLRTFAKLVSFLDETYGRAPDFPAAERPRGQQKRDLTW